MECTSPFGLRKIRRARWWCWGRAVGAGLLTLAISSCDSLFGPSGPPSGKVEVLTERIVPGNYDIRFSFSGGDLRPWLHVSIGNFHKDSISNQEQSPVAKSYFIDRVGEFPVSFRVANEKGESVIAVDTLRGLNRHPAVEIELETDIIGTVSDSSLVNVRCTDNLEVICSLSFQDSSYTVKGDSVVSLSRYLKSASSGIYPVIATAEDLQGNSVADTLDIKANTPPLSNISYISRVVGIGQPTNITLDFHDSDGTLDSTRIYFHLNDEAASLLETILLDSTEATVDREYFLSSSADSTGYFNLRAIAFDDLGDSSASAEGHTFVAPPPAVSNVIADSSIVIGRDIIGFAFDGSYLDTLSLNMIAGCYSSFVKFNNDSLNLKGSISGEVPGYITDSDVAIDSVEVGCADELGQVMRKYSNPVEMVVFDELESMVDALPLNTVTRISIENPYTLDHLNQVVHPDIAVVRGYGMVLAITPFPHANCENPVINTSFDGFTFFKPGGLENPVADVEGRTCAFLPSGMPSVAHSLDRILDEVPRDASGRIMTDEAPHMVTIPQGVQSNFIPINGGGHLSDTDILYDQDFGKFMLYFRQTGDRIFLMESHNLVSWSKPEVVLEGQFADLLSPSIIKKDGEYKMWSINSPGCNAGGGDVELRTSLDGRNWSEPVQVNISQPGYKVWHIDVNHVPERNEYWTLFAASPDGVFGCTSTDLFAARSPDTDGVNWETFSVPVLKKGDFEGSERQVYRSTFHYSPNIGKVLNMYSAYGNDFGWNAAISVSDFDEYVSRLEQALPPVIR